jgi:hypothetical protein
MQGSAVLLPHLPQPLAGNKPIRAAGRAGLFLRWRAFHAHLRSCSRGEAHSYAPDCISLHPTT